MKYKLVQWIKDQWFEYPPNSHYPNGMSLELVEEYREEFNKDLEQAGWKYSERRYAIRPCT